MTYVVVDIETTGLSRERNRITEIAAVRVHENEIVDSFQSLVDPQVQIPRFITRLTGIDNELVRGAPPIQDVIPRFLDFLGPSVLVAHNATFDWGFLNHNAIVHTGVPITNERICTKKLANRLLPDLPRKRLSNLCEHFQVTNATAHRAMSDVLATTQVFFRFSEMLAQQGVVSPEQVVEFQK